MKLKKLFTHCTIHEYAYGVFLFLILFFSPICSNLKAQSCSADGKNINFNLSQTAANCSDGTITVTLDAADVASTGYGIVVLNITGPQLYGPHEITGKTTTISELASGEYTVTLTGYCSTQINEADKGGSVTGKVTVGGSYIAPEFAHEVTRKALTACSETGEITFNFSNGRTPYKVEILSGSPSRVGEVIFADTEAGKKIVVGNLKAGNYKFRIHDNCRSREETRTLDVISDNEISMGSRVVPKKDNDCETVRILTVDVAEDFAIHLPKTGSSDDTGGNIYFEVYTSDDENGTQNKVSCPFTYETKNKYLNFDVKIPGGYAALRGKYITLKRVIDDGCSVKNEFTRTSFISNTDATMKSFYGIDASQIDCENYGLTIPVSGIKQMNVTAFVCTPINYVIRDSEGTEVKSGSFTWATGPEFYKLEAGQYTVYFTDNSGRSWTDTETVINDHILDHANINVNLSHQGRKTTIVDCNSDSDDCHYTFARLNGLNSSMIGMTLRYAEVPDNFYYPSGTEIEIKSHMLINSNTGMVLNSLWESQEKVCRLVPGNYKIEVVDKSCIIPKSISTTFTAYQTQLYDFDYSVRYQCGSAYMSVDPQTKLTFNNQTYAGDNVLFAVEHKVGNASLSLNKTYKRADGIQEIELPLSGEYKIVFSYVGSGGGTAGNATSIINQVAIRHVNVQMQSFQFSDIDTRAYLCPDALSGAVITTRTENGSGQTQYTIYKKNASNTFDKIGTEVVSEGDLLVFEDAVGKVGDEYKIEAMDDCTELISKGVIASSLKDKLSIAGQLTGCLDDNITIKATYIPGATYQWFFKEEGGSVYTELNGITTSEYEISSFNKTNHSGFYKVIFNISGCSTVDVETQVKAAPAIVVWSPQNGSSDWDDENNWYPVGVPAGCTDVYIPGDVATFPELVAEGGNTCRDIYFLPGGQLGQPQYLVYRNAHVQMDLGMYSSPQQKITSATDFVDNIAQGDPDNLTTEDRLKFGAGRSKEAMERNRWYMISAPLKSVFSGDYAFGGYPYTYMRKFDKDAAANNSFTAGRWSDFYSSLVEELNPAEGFAYWVNEHRHQMRYLERGSEWISGMSQVKPMCMKNTDVFGLGENNGILHFPHHNDNYLSSRRRNHSYDNVTEESTFHYFVQSPQTSPHYMQFIGESDTKKRENPHRFIAETVSEGKTTLDVAYNIGSYENPQGEFVLLGNPYMSGLNFAEFQKDNEDLIKEGYQLWTGSGFSVYPNESVIAPMQSFLVELKEVAPVNTDLIFDYTVANISTTNGAVSLRSGVSAYKANSLQVTAENEHGKITTQIRQRDDARDDFCDLDMSKIIEFPLRNSTPEIYTIAPVAGTGKNKGLVVNSIQSDNLIIPLGIATTYSGQMKLILTGMDNYNANISFIDSQFSTVDITGMASFEYPFFYTANLDDKGYGIANEQRFSIRISGLPTAISNQIINQLSVYNVASNLFVCSSSAEIKQIELYNIQGQLLYKEENIGAANYEVQGILNHSGVYVVKVYTEGEVKEFKLIRY